MCLSCPLAQQLTQWGRWARDHAALGYRRAVRHGEGFAPVWMSDDAIERVDRAIAAVPESARLVLKLRYLSGQKDRLGAKRIGVSVSTYRRRVAVAQALVREAMDQ